MASAISRGILIQRMATTALAPALRELVRLKDSRELYPQHPRAFDYDRAREPIQGYPGGGGYAGDLYDIAYAKAMLQAALLLERAGCNSQLNAFLLPMYAGAGAIKWQFS